MLKRERDVQDVALFSKIKICKIPYNRIEKDNDMKTNTMQYYIKAGYFKVKDRISLTKYFKTLSKQLWDTKEMQ